MKKTSKTKILYIVSSLKRSGPTNQLLSLVQHIGRDEFDLEILTLSPDPLESLKSKFEALDVNIHEHPIARFKLSKKSLTDLINKINPDVIHSSGIRADRISSMISSHYPVVSTIHNFMFEDYLLGYNAILGRIMVHCHLRYLKNIQKPIVCSQSIEKMYKEKNIEFTAIPNGVDTEVFSPEDNLDSNVALTKMSIPINKKIIISTGHLSQRKDPLTIINGFVISSIYQESVLVFLGDGPLMEKAKGVSQNHKNIFFLGRVDNIVDYLKISDVFVSGSRSEGLPYALLEAMSCNLPVVLSSIPQHREVCGTEAISEFFEIANVNQVSKAFNGIFKKIDKKNNKNRSIIVDSFSSKLMSLKYQEVYKNIKFNKL